VGKNFSSKNRREVGTGFRDSLIISKSYFIGGEGRPPSYILTLYKLEGKRMKEHC